MDFIQMKFLFFKKHGKESEKVSYRLAENTCNHISRIYKEILQLKTINSPNKYWHKNMENHFSKVNMQMAKKLMKKSSEINNLQEKANSNLMRYHFIPNRMFVVKKSDKSLGKLKLNLKLPHNQQFFSFVFT